MVGYGVGLCHSFSVSYCEFLYFGFLVAAVEGFGCRFDAPAHVGIERVLEPVLRCFMRSCGGRLAAFMVCQQAFPAAR